MGNTSNIRNMFEITPVVVIVCLAIISTAYSDGENHSCPSTSSYNVELTCCGNIVNDTVKITAGANVRFTCSVHIPGITGARLCFEPTFNLDSTPLQFDWEAPHQFGTYVVENFPMKFNGRRIACVITDDTGQSIHSVFLLVIVVDADGGATTRSASTTSTSVTQGGSNPTTPTGSSAQGGSNQPMGCSDRGCTTTTKRTSEENYSFIALIVPVVVLIGIIGLVIVLICFRKKIRNFCRCKMDSGSPKVDPPEQEDKKNYTSGSSKASFNSSSQDDSEDKSSDNVKFMNGMQDEQGTRQSQTVVSIEKTLRMRPPSTKADRSANGGSPDENPEIHPKVEEVIPTQESVTRIDAEQSDLSAKSDELVTGVGKTSGENSDSFEVPDGIVGYNGLTHIDSKFDDNM